MTGCLEADGSATIGRDERGAARLYGEQCDIGPYEFDDDRIYANSFQSAL